MDKILCQIKGHGNFQADFVCLGNCDNELKLACSQCKTFQHSKCGLKCVLQNDLKNFFKIQESQLQDLNQNKQENYISLLFNAIDQSFKTVFQQNKKNQFYYLEIDELIKNCQIYKDQYPYDRTDCEKMNKYFHDKIKIDFKNNQTQFSLKLRLQDQHQQIVDLIQDSASKITNILKEFQNRYNEINNQSIFYEDQPIKIVEIQQNQPLQKPELIQQKVPQIIKEFKCIQRQGQKFGIVNDTIQNQDIDDQLIIFEPKINSSDENLCWSYKISEHGWIPIVFNEPYNFYDLGIGVVGANYINKDIIYKKSENQQYLVFSQGTTNFKQINGFKFTQTEEVTLKYDVKSRILEIKGKRGQPVQFQLDNSDYYPCLVLSKKDKVILVQPKMKQQN